MQTTHNIEKSIPFLPENEGEVARLLLQQRRLCTLMGGAVPPWLDLSKTHTVLDLACGPGGWAQAMVEQHPDMHVVGIDGSSYFIQQAKTLFAGKQPNVCYIEHDLFALDTLKPELFDLIHLSFLAGKVTFQQFPALLQSVARLCKPGGSIVWTEAELPITTSSACDNIESMLLSALLTTGRAFSPGFSLRLGINSWMNYWLYEAGCRLMQDKDYHIDVSYGTEAHATFTRQAWVFGHQVRRFLLDSNTVTATYFEQTFTQALQEMQAKGFHGICPLRTLIATKRGARERIYTNASTWATWQREMCVGAR